MYDELTKSDIKKMEEDLEAFYFRGKKLKEEVPVQKMEKIKKEEAQEEFNIAREIVSTILYVFAAVLFTFLFVNFVGERTLVSGSSMESTLSDGDQLYLDKLTGNDEIKIKNINSLKDIQFNKNTVFVISEKQNINDFIDIKGATTIEIKTLENLRK